MLIEVDILIGKWDENAFRALLLRTLLKVYIHAYYNVWYIIDTQQTLVPILP